MKTIATAAILMMLSAPTWADEAENKQANSNDPIVLSEAEMDGVTAGGTEAYINWILNQDFTSASTVDSTEESSGRHTPFFSTYRPQFY